MSVADRAKLKPGQRVAVFPWEAASGATIGYYGTVIGPLEDVLRETHRPLLAWRYRVFVKGDESLVDALQILPVGSVPPSEFLTDVQGRTILIRFESPPAEDNDVLGGVFRLQGRGWAYFLFTKQPQIRATYEFRLATESSRLRSDILTYCVPSFLRLDRGFVLGAIGEVLRS